MKDGAVRKVNFCFNSERIRTEDCSLETDTEFFRIGEAEIEKARLGDPDRTDIKPKEASSRCLPSTSSHPRVSIFNIKKTQKQSR